MAEEKPDFRTQIRTLLGRLTRGQKILIVAVALGVVAGVIILTNVMNAVRYGVLYSNLPMNDSAVIVEKLKEKKVPYELAAGGTVIRVPEGQIAELRLELAAQGLPEGGGIGFEIFDKTSLSTTDFVQNINYVRALEGELARSISHIREVSFAKVHITLPKKSVFIEEQEPAKASIILKLKPGAVLAQSMIPAIMHLTSQSVEGLTPENIAVIDVNGRLLSRPKGQLDAYDENAQQNFLHQKKMEDSYAKEIVDLLEPIVGSGKVRADVRLNLDFNKVETREEKVDPDNVAKVSEQTETSSEIGGPGSGGVPGTGSNVAGATVSANTAGTAGTQIKRESARANYEISKTTTHVFEPVGKIRNLSVAVVVDNALVTSTQGGNLQKRSVPRNDGELQRLKKLVQAAVGFNAQRGDIVEVENLGFDTSGETETEYLVNRYERHELRRTLIQYGIYLLIGLLVFFLILRPLIRKITEMMRGPAPIQAPIEIPRIDTEKLAELQRAKDEAELEKELQERYRVPMEVKKMNILRERVQEFAKENPDNVASLIRSFLMEQ